MAGSSSKRKRKVWFLGAPQTLDKNGKWVSAAKSSVACKNESWPQGDLSTELRRHLHAVRLEAAAKK